jgi:hypothetical protein
MLAGTAVKVTEVPWQNEVVGVVMLTEGVRLCVTDMVMLLLLTVGVIAQASLLVIVQVITSLLARLEVVKTGALLPILFPFFFH